MLREKKACGAKKKKPEDMAKHFNTTMAPDLIQWLDEMKRDGAMKARIIDKALREYREKVKVENVAVRRDNACRAALERCHKDLRDRKHSGSVMLQLRVDMEGIYETDF